MPPRTGQRPGRDQRFCNRNRVGGRNVQPARSLRAESFNLFNRTNFELPGANGATNNRVTSSTFGLAGGTFFPRELQFGLKLSF